MWIPDKEDHWKAYTRSASLASARSAHYKSTQAHTWKEHHRHPYRAHGTSTRHWYSTACPPRRWGTRQSRSSSWGPRANRVRAAPCRWKCGRWLGPKWRSCCVGTSPRGLCTGRGPCRAPRTCSRSRRSARTRSSLWLGWCRLRTRATRARRGSSTCAVQWLWFCPTMTGSLCSRCGRLLFLCSACGTLCGRGGTLGLDVCQRCPFHCLFFILDFIRFFHFLYFNDPLICMLFACKCYNMI